MKVNNSRFGAAGLFSTLIALASCNVPGDISNGKGQPAAQSPSPSAPLPVPVSLQSPGVLIVNSTDDETDALPGDRACASASGKCTLRAAVQESNATVILDTNVLHRTNLIIVPAGHYKITLAPPAPSVVGEGLSNFGQMSFLGTTNIRGAGAGKTIIDGNQLDRVFALIATATVSISDVTITGGISSGIWNEGQLTLTRVTVSNNSGLYGGGVFNTPTSSLVMESSTVSDNIAENEGGGMRCDASCLIINSTISGNKISADCCSGTTMDGMTAGEGGGIDSRGGGPVTIVNSTIVNNHAVIGGGGVNTAVFYQGDPAGVLDDTGFIGRPIELINTIVANNTSDRGPNNCKATISEVRSLGGNISNDESCGLTAVNDLQNTDPKLGEMSAQPSSPPAYRLSSGSPAIGNGVKAHCPVLDQTIAIRGDRCDSGAVQAF